MPPANAQMPEEPNPAASVPADNQPAESSAAVASIASDLVATMSAPQPHAMEAARKEVEGASQDKFGHAFDPAIHATNADGSPKLTPTGRFAKLSKSTRESTLRVPGKQPATSPAAPASVSKEMAARASGKGAANLFIMGCLVIGGEEWMPQADPKSGLNEREMLEAAFGDYFVATGKTDLPPGWALAAGIFMYAGRRLGMPKTQSRIAKVKSWLVAKYVNFKNRKQKGVRVKADTDESEA